MKSLLLPRIAVAVLWFYQGLYLILLLHDPHALKIVASLLGASHASMALTLVGVGETLLGLAVLIGLWTRPVAIVQIVLVLALNLLAYTHRGLFPHPDELFVYNLPFFACLGMLAIHGPGRWNV